MIGDLISRLSSKEPSIVEDALLECVFLFEKATADRNADVDRLLHAVSETCFTGNIRLQSAALFAIGKLQRQSALEVLRNVSEATLQSCDSVVVWQWLIAYDNLVGLVVRDEDVYLFRLIESAFYNNSKIRKYLQSFVFNA